jgi:hypothetical protein
MKQFIFFALVLTLQSCTSRKTIDARIYERKEVPENKLMIKYEYRYKNEMHRDSAIVENTIIETDSIILVTKPENGKKAVPVLK